MARSIVAYAFAFAATTLAGVDGRAGLDTTRGSQDVVAKRGNLTDVFISRAFTASSREAADLERTTLGKSVVVPQRTAVLRAGSVLPSSSPRMPRPQARAIRGEALHWIGGRPPVQLTEKRAQGDRTPRARDVRGKGFRDAIKNAVGWEEEGISVVRLQLALLGTATEVQRQLDDLASRANTETQQGLFNILSDTTLLLLRNTQYLAYGYADTYVTDDPDKAEEAFNEYSMEERSKFDEETVSNVDGFQRSGSNSGQSRGPEALRSQYILVTILLAYDDEKPFNLPKMDSLLEADQALRKLGRTQVDRVTAVEVIWNPQEEGDTLTADELLLKYPQMMQL